MVFSSEYNVKNVLEIILRHYIIIIVNYILVLLCPVVYTCMMLFFKWAYVLRTGQMEHQPF